jgi:hypothetical protein
MKDIKNGKYIKSTPYVKIEAENNELYVHTDPEPPKIISGGKAKYMGHDGKYHIWDLQGRYHSQNGIKGEFKAGGMIIPTQSRVGRIKKDDYLRLTSEEKEYVHNQLPDGKDKKKDTGGKIELPRKKFIREHKYLIELLSSADDSVFKQEAMKQRKELDSYKKALAGLATANPYIAGGLAAANIGLGAYSITRQNKIKMPKLQDFQANRSFMGAARNNFAQASQNALSGQAQRINNQLTNAANQAQRSTPFAAIAAALTNQAQGTALSAQNDLARQQADLGMQRSNLEMQLGQLDNQYAAQENQSRNQNAMAKYQDEIMRHNTKMQTLQGMIGTGQSLFKDLNTHGMNNNLFNIYKQQLGQNNPSLRPSISNPILGSVNSNNLSSYSSNEEPESFGTANSQINSLPQSTNSLNSASSLGERLIGKPLKSSLWYAPKIKFN